MNDSCSASYNCGGQVAFVFRLPAGQVDFSGLFLTLSLSVYCLCLASHNANQFLPLLFHRKELHIFIFLLLSCILYLRCSVRNLLTGRSKSVKKII